VTNRMHDSLTLFKTVINNKWLRETPVILFLNKTDLFTERFVSHKDDFLKCFPDFKGAKDFLLFIFNFFLFFVVFASFYIDFKDKKRRRRSISS
jgi:hypothetical protein